MPVTIEVSAETGAAIGIGTGPLTLEEMKNAAMAIWERPDFARERVLWDMRDASFSLSAPEVQALADFTKKGSVLRPGARMAFVVSRDLQYGLVRMFEAYREQRQVEIHVFRDLGEAEAWLGELPAGL